MLFESERRAGFTRFWKVNQGTGTVWLPCVGKGLDVEQGLGKELFGTRSFPKPTLLLLGVGRT